MCIRRVGERWGHGSGRSAFGELEGLATGSHDQSGACSEEPKGIAASTGVMGCPAFVGGGEEAEGGAVEEFEPLGAGVGAEPVGVVEMDIGVGPGLIGCGDGEVAGDAFLAWRALGAVGAAPSWGFVLDDLRNADGAAFALPGVFGGGFGSGVADAEADGVDAAGAKDAGDVFEVIEHGAIGGEVADGVDGVEGQGDGAVVQAEAFEGWAGGEGGHVGDGEAGEARGRVEVEFGGAGLGVADHGLCDVEADAGAAVFGCEEDEAPGAAGGFEPEAALGVLGDPTAFEGEEATGVALGARGVEDVVDLGVVVETLLSARGGHGEGEYGLVNGQLVK